MYIMQPKLDPTRKVIKWFDLKKMHACTDLSILQQILALSAAVRHQHVSIWEARVHVWDAREPRAKTEAVCERKGSLMVMCDRKDFSAGAPRPT